MSCLSSSRTHLHSGLSTNPPKITQTLRVYALVTYCNEYFITELDNSVETTPDRNKKFNIHHIHGHISAGGMRIQNSKYYYIK